MRGEKPLHLPPNLGRLKEAEDFGRRPELKVCWADRNWLCNLERCEPDCPIRSRLWVERKSLGRVENSHEEGNSHLQ
jgi:hypothetical protein